ncbi:hypothetical protein QTO34_008816 [Cnephaeus nilssonii]|uniref:Fibronectin type-III domain-containing protein n=1 Tax=Cnephaeus nilssonii TaxID=3371016 RepID=A0AA40HGP8_CNENI|nr:hypothetical protein QTO34_008816 [Eptesicus nilssonii]
MGILFPEVRTTSVRLIWQPPAAPNGIILAYQVTHRLNATTANTAAVEVLAPSARQYTATGLKPESVYLFRITAQTRKGWGEAAEALVVTTEKRGDCPLGLGRPEGQLSAPPTHPPRCSDPLPTDGWAQLARVTLPWPGMESGLACLTAKESSGPPRPGACLSHVTDLLLSLGVPVCAMDQHPRPLPRAEMARHGRQG